MAKAVQSVEAFLSTLVHARKAEIESLRAAILKSDAAITERVKWNAPSFVWDGDDRVTMLLNPGDRLGLVFHRGARAKKDPAFAFDDPTGLIVWAANDRGVITLPDAKALATQKAKIVKLVGAWMRAT